MEHSEYLRRKTGKKHHLAMHCFSIITVLVGLEAFLSKEYGILNKEHLLQNGVTVSG
jgi:hypothetical protein